MKRNTDREKMERAERNLKTWNLAKAVIRAASAEERAYARVMRAAPTDTLEMFTSQQAYRSARNRLHKTVREQREWKKERTR